MIDRPTIERILAAADIVDVVSEFVTLKKAGMNYKGLCPFHSDSTPSFSVSPSRNYCHCFSCGKGGTPVGFIMEHEQMTYPEALRWLARKYHIEIKERELTSEEKQQESERESMFIVNEWAAEYYRDILHNDATGRAIGMQYFRSRGFRDDIIERFRLGFALEDRQAMPREATSKGYRPEFLVKTGLCYSRDNNVAPQTAKAGDLVDRFAGRAIFPWIGLSGKVVAFGGRKLDRATKGVQQKYVNSPESVIYHKDHELYGIYQGKKAIAKEDCVFMVEGYTDVISMHQSGIENVVANSGTALSTHQIHMLHRLTKNIVLLYDGDAAGIKAALRGTDMLLSEGMNIKVLILPDGDDPDSFARKHNAEEFRQYVETHQTDFIQFKTDILLQGVTDPVKRSEAISSIVKSVSVIPDNIIRAAYLQDCAMRLGMSEQTLLTRMNRFISEAIEERKKRRQIENSRGNAGTDGNAPTSYSQTSASGNGGQASTSGGSGQSAAGNGGQSAVGNGGQLAANAPYPDDFPPDFPPDDIPPEAYGKPTEGFVPPAASSVSVPASSTYPSATIPSASKPAASKKSTIEHMIIESVIRHGEEIVKKDVETEDGQKIDLTLAQYVYINLAEDGLMFENEMYERILAEAVQRSGQEGFYAAPFFSQSPDIEVSQFASGVLQERFVLSKSLERKYTIDSLLGNIEHLLLELRREIIDTELIAILKEISSNINDREKAEQLMEKYREMKTLSIQIARKLGKNLR